MKVLHVIPAFYPAHVYGGPTQATYELCRSLARLGAEVRVLTTDANGLREVLDVEKNREVSLEGFTVRYCRRRLRHSVSPNLLRWLPSHVAWADIVHLSYVYSFPTFPTLLQCRRAGKPVVWSPAGGLQRWQGSSRRGIKSAWDFLWYHTTDLSRLTVHVTSEQEQRETTARLPRLMVRVIPNGVDIPSDLKPGALHEDFRLLFLGRLHPIKAIESLLQACGKLRDTPGLPWRLAIAGWGEEAYVSELKQQIEILGVQDRVSLLGPVVGPTRQRLFEDSDVVIVPSHSESFGLVVAEALAHGVPVIASKGTPWQEVEKRGCGLWVENAPDALASAIARIHSMPLKDMGKRGRDWMQRYFTWDVVGKRMLNLYEASLSP